MNLLVVSCYSSSIWKTVISILFDYHMKNILLYTYLLVLLSFVNSQQCHQTRLLISPHLFHHQPLCIKLNRMYSQLIFPHLSSVYNELFKKRKCFISGCPKHSNGTLCVLLTWLSHEKHTDVYPLWGSTLLNSVINLIFFPIILIELYYIILNMISLNQNIHLIYSLLIFFLLHFFHHLWKGFISDFFSYQHNVAQFMQMNCKLKF